MNIYYVYIYLNPNISGNFRYDDFFFEYEPFYVGKGKRNRDVSHLKMTGSNQTKIEVIRQILNAGKKPVIQRLFTNLSNEEAIVKEKIVIDVIGKRRNNTGPLLNFKDGGYRDNGGYKLNLTSEQRKNISLRKSGKNHHFFGKSDHQIGELNPMYNVKGEKHFMFGKHRTIEEKAKISKNHANISGEANPRAKLTKFKVDVIRRYFNYFKNENKMLILHERVCQKYNISLATSRKINNNTSWKI